MELPIYQIDAFTGDGYAGNPAAVVPITDWPEDELLQHIAQENNLSETAFVAPEGRYWRLRWFTPVTEVELCGHATLATAFVLWHYLGVTASRVHFLTHSGQLTAKRKDDLIQVQLPEAPTTSARPELVQAVWQALRTRGETVLEANFPLAVLASAEQLRQVTPDMDAIRRLDSPGLIVTAPGDQEEVDFASRFFAPALGIPEDPVSGTAHCALVPYWAARIGRPELHALQLSPRGGELFCTQESGQVVLAGRAQTYLEGRIFV